jgi:hypothetical protein
LFGGNNIKKVAVTLFLLGAIAIMIGLIPFVFDFPYNNSENSGPRNYWELIIMMAYDGVYLPIGIVMLLAGIILIYKMRRKVFIKN